VTAPLSSAQPQPENRWLREDDPASDRRDEEHSEHERVARRAKRRRSTITDREQVQQPPDRCKEEAAPAAGPKSLMTSHGGTESSRKPTSSTVASVARPGKRATRPMANQRGARDRKQSQFPAQIVVLLRSRPQEVRKVVGCHVRHSLVLMLTPTVDASLAAGAAAPRPGDAAIVEWAARHRIDTTARAGRGPGRGESRLIAWTREVPSLYSCTERSHCFL